MKLIILSALAVICLAEPPVENSYLPPQQRGPPSTLYGTPIQKQTDALFRSRQPSNQYGPPQAPSSYEAPSTQYGTPSQGISSQYGVPSSPSNQYGAPGFDGSDGFSHTDSLRDQDQSREYLPPGAGGRNGYGNDEGHNAPANYNFEYMVLDEQSGNDFGHREARQGDRAEGIYYVLLPDGRKQTVEYEADQAGYRPKISYEDTGLGQGGYGRNNGFNGY